MPRRVGYGRPGTTVFPADWSATAAGVLDRTHESTVTIGPRGATRSWSEADQQTVTAAAASAYEGAATLRPASESDGGTQPVVGEDQVAVARYQVGLLQPTGGIKVGHVVHVTASPDAALVGRDLTVVEVEYGDRRFTRHLYATLND